MSNFSKKKLRAVSRKTIEISNEVFPRRRNSSTKKSTTTEENENSTDTDSDQWNEVEILNCYYVLAFIINSHGKYSWAH